jgi:hypothetical protein
MTVRTRVEGRNRGADLNRHLIAAQGFLAPPAHALGASERTRHVPRRVTRVQPLARVARHAGTLGISVVACLAPALRAVGTNPVRTLRGD